MSKTLDKSIVDVAWAIAHKAHAGQSYARYRCNWEYITHIKRVVHNLGDADRVTEIVAILHDVVEDSDVTIGEIGTIFGPKICSAVTALTHVQTEVYGEYIERCAKNPIARLVKSIDIADHILHCVRPDAPEEWRSMLKQYIEAMRILHSL